jgi:hypothetical protein
MQQPDTTDDAAPGAVAATRTHLTPVSSQPRHQGSAEGEARVLERNLVRRVVISTAICIPVFAIFYAALVALAVRNVGVAVGPAVAMGAGVGVLAATFWGLWIGVAASVKELEEAEHVARRTQRDGATR